MSSEKVQLTIRCAMQTFSDYNIECETDWTILQLKEHLSQICSFKPEIARQRLIYAGRCLENNQKVHEILRLHRDGIRRPAEEQLEKQVIHMVYIGTETPQRNGEGIRHRANVASARPQLAPNVLGQNIQQQPSSMPMPTFDYNVQQQQNHEAWMTAYNNYMANMMQFYGQPGAVGMMPYNAWNPNQNHYGNYGQAFFTPQQQMVGIPAGQHLPVANQPIFNEQQANQPQPLVNIQAGNNNNVQQVPDFLDLIYKSIRFALFAMVLFLYSSVERFFFVVAIVALFWIVQMRRGQNRRRQPNGGAEPMREQAAPQNQPNVAENDANLQAENQEVPEAIPVQAAAPLTFNTAWNIFSTVVRTFFTSLIPENHVPLDIN